MSTLTEDELVQTQLEDYIRAVALKLGFGFETLPADVRSRIELCGQHGFSATEAFYSVKEALRG
jgi:hypothetical protein